MTRKAYAGNGINHGQPRRLLEEAPLYVYRIMLFLVFGGYLLSPLLMSGWGQAGAAWYRPFAIWGVLIALTLWLDQKRTLDER